MRNELEKFLEILQSGENLSEDKTVEFFLALQSEIDDENLIRAEHDDLAVGRRHCGCDDTVRQGDRFGQGQGACRVQPQDQKADHRHHADDHDNGQHRDKPRQPLYCGGCNQF